MRDIELDYSSSTSPPPPSRWRGAAVRFMRVCGGLLMGWGLFEMGVMVLVMLDSLKGTRFDVAGMMEIAILALISITVGGIGWGVVHLASRVRRGDHAAIKISIWSFRALCVVEGAFVASGMYEESGTD